MRSIRPAWFIGVCLAAIVSAWAAPTTSAESDVLSWEPATSVTLTFDVGKDPTAAHGTAILRNPSPADQAIELRFVGDEKVDALTLVTPPDSIPAGSAMEVDLVVPGGVELVGLSGSLVAEASPAGGTAAVGPAVVPFAIVAPGGNAKTQLAEPSSVSMTVDRCVPVFLVELLGFLDRPALRDCLVYWPSGLHPEPGRPTATVKIHGNVLKGTPAAWTLAGDAGTLDVSISTSSPSVSATPSASPDPSASPASGAAAPTGPLLMIQVAHPGPPGEYSGDVPVEPAVADSLSVPTTVHVQDFILWPLLAILAGAWVTYLRVPLRDRRRARAVTAKRLTEVFESTYPRGCHYKLTAFPEPVAPTKPGGPPTWPPRSGTLTPGEELYDEIEKTRTQEGLDDLAKKVEALDVVVSQWKAACKRRGELEDKLAEVKKDPDPPETAPMMAATEALIARTDDFLDKDDATKLANALRDQIEALGIWADAWKSYERSDRLWTTLKGAGLPDNERLILHTHHPAMLRDAYLLPAKSLEEVQQSDLTSRAREIHGVLASLAASHEIPEPPEAPRARSRGAARTLPRAASVPPPARVIAESIERGDLYQFLGTAAAVSLIYLSTIYPGNDFGSVWQYLTAFLAGSAGTLLIKWDLLPWTRSYRPAAPKA